MSWKECVDEGIITQSTPDEERSNQMLMMANLRLKFWDKKVADEFIVLKVEAYYDIIKELFLLISTRMAIIARIIFASLPISKKRSKTLTLKLRKLMNYVKCGMKSIIEG